MSLLNSAFVRRTVGFMLAGVAVLFGIVGTSVWLASQTRDHAEGVARARDIRTLSSNLLTSLLDAETGQRGFLLTDAERYLEPFEDAKGRLITDLDHLRILVTRDPGASRSIERLTPLVNAKLAELAETIAIAKAGRREAALEVVNTDRGKGLMDEARRILDELIAATEARVASRMADLDSAAKMLTLVTLAGGSLIVIFAAGAFWTVFRYARELVNARDQVETLNFGLERRVAERTSALARANDEIQRFAYIVSHDLRAPLVNIMGFTKELEVSTAALQKFVAAGSAETAHLTEAAQTAANDDLPEAVRFIRASTAKMDTLINAILKMSREGRRELNLEPVDLGKLFASVTASVRHQVEEAGARFELPARFPLIVSDRVALEQIFSNLVDNAVKYLSPDRLGVIKVQTEETDRVRITVTDNGRGIAAQDHERIFELFRRSGQQDRPGEGIGLAHVRALVRRLGGDITVQSQLGEGAAFQVSLPKSLVLTNESYGLS
jgi:signal transduction histidine kinase